MSVVCVWGLVLIKFINERFIGVKIKFCIRSKAVIIAKGNGHPQSPQL